ncbi:ArsR/SmtB family transcription factor [Salinimicrobium sediminilitoris]|uniref:ArsR/SmtB family transcription factor n=1 Tax=Salinimicrobium sediminilitoris TaxID=2876715 RepID=UPI001E636150|nr:metalloregulator ArsR/SmtB family transcription factor [Salinimicrobium sediminilitoris]MCC8360592.1 metalloregulator ArsR/SmtB family transcription factor [Salinimicrobium sediminilitoris]
MKDMNCIRKEADLDQIKRCQEQISEAEEAVSALTDKLSLVSNSVRLKILYVLQTEERLCVCDLSDILNMTIPAVSQHLRKLKDRDFVKAEKEGQTIFYSLRNDHRELLAPFFNLIIHQPEAI